VTEAVVLRRSSARRYHDSNITLEPSFEQHRSCFDCAQHDIVMVAGLAS
jgi:hypothetical protein